VQVVFFDLEHRLILDRVGFPTWSSYMMGAGLLAIVGGVLFLAIAGGAGSVVVMRESAGIAGW